MKPSLTNTVAIITGGSKGYGAGIAEHFKQQGANVWITGRDEKSLTATAHRLGVHAVVADVTKGSDWDRLFAQVIQATGRVDVLINNAGHAVSIKPLTEQTDDDIAESIAINLTGTILGCRRAATVMQQQKSGTIINISSICAKYAWPGWSVYSAAKAGVGSVTKCLYTELRTHGVRVTTLIPSWGATDFAATPDLAGHPVRDAAIRAQCTKPVELGEIAAHICTLPPHLEVLEYTVVPMVQEIMPL